MQREQTQYRLVRLRPEMSGLLRYRAVENHSSAADICTLDAYSISVDHLTLQSAVNSCFLPHNSHEGGGRHDLDVAHRAHCQQIAIAADDQIGAAIDGEFEEFVIGRITAERQALGDGDRLGCGENPADAVEKYRRDLGREARSLQDVEKLLFRSRAFEETALMPPPLLLTGCEYQRSRSGPRPVQRPPATQSGCHEKD